MTISDRATQDTTRLSRRAKLDTTPAGHGVALRQRHRPLGPVRLVPSVEMEVRGA